MGEVYRADDLKLGQSVALKFLPKAFNADHDRLERFLNEVRLARQVSHPNVCRIYDAGEVDGHHFLSMEYVDGEDLASLLRRIGHVPKDKAIQIARQLCAGLAAAHDAGVLHRDLKPANVMVDGRGRARITDFGLAALAEQVAGHEILSGTPAYMAPEQLSGQSVSVRSDLYALGLVLYELFTGRRAFTAATANELRRLQSETTPSSPSSLVEGFDPAVERVILRCLDPDPARRPASALSVAAALPGGDPLAAALAAGETPSPEMVAEAGETGAISPAIAWAALGVFVVSLVAFFALATRTSLVAIVPLEKPPEVLRERARSILAQAGYERPPADSLYAFEPDRGYLDDLLHRKDAGAARWDALRSAPPGAVTFWYRQSPEALVPKGAANIGDWITDPAYTVPGSARVGLDPDGRLVSLLVVPGESAGALAGGEPDWTPLLQATGVDAKTLVPAAPAWAPPVFADRRAAWTGSWPGHPAQVVRIEAAAVNARPTWLRVVEPWERPNDGPGPAGGFAVRASKLTGAITFVTVLAIAAIVAWRNVRRGRGDRRGALRLALYLGAARMLWFLGAHHVAASEEADLFGAHFAYSMYRLGFAYVAYLAIEPYARRLWPRFLVSWVRVLDGRFRDPLVGRDLLIGCAAGAVGAALERVQIMLSGVLGGAPSPPNWSPWTFEPLRGAVPALVSVVAIHTQEVLDVVFPLTLMLVFRWMFRRTLPAFVAMALVGLVLFLPAAGSVPAYVLRYAITTGMFGYVLFRAGILGAAAVLATSGLVSQLPLTPHPAAWFAGATLFSIAAISAPVAWGFYSSQAWRPIVRDEILEPAARR